MSEVKKFIIDESILEEAEKTGSAKRGKPTATFETVLNDECDLVVRKTTKTKSTLLVMLFTKGQFYLKNEKTGTIEPLNESNLRSFTNLGQSFNTGSWVMPKLPYGKAAISFVVDYATKDEMFLDAVRHGIISIPTSVENVFSDTLANKYALAGINKEDLPLLKMIAKEMVGETKPLFHIGVYQWGGYGEIIDYRVRELLSFIEEVYGHSGLKYFVHKVCASYGVRFFKERHYGTNMTPERIRDTLSHMPCKKMVDFFTETLYFQFVSGGFPEWLDYLKMQQDVYGKIVDKYPKALLTDKAILEEKHRIMQQEIDAAKFEKRVEALKKNEMDFESVSIKTPQSPGEIIDASKTLSNCLSSYVSSHADGTHDIYLLKENDVCVGAIQVTNGKVVQAKREYNKRLHEDTQQCVCKWAKNLGLEIETGDIQTGAA